MGTSITPHFTEGTQVQVQAEFYTSSVLSTAVAANVSITQLEVTPLGGPLAVGDTVTVAEGNNSFTFTVATAAITGAGVIEVDVVAPTWSFDEGATVSYLVDPATISFSYRPGRYQTTVTVTYAANQISRAAKGIYFAVLDTSGKPGFWNGYWSSTGAGQVTSSTVGFVVDQTPF